MSRKPLIYLASPYSHKDEDVKACRFDKINEIAAKLILLGFHVFSPISMSHPIAEASGVPMGGWIIEDGKFKGWEAIDTNILSRCDEFWIANLDGWDKSVGVRAEFEYAQLHMNVFLLEGIDAEGADLVPLNRYMYPNYNSAFKRIVE